MPQRRWGKRKKEIINIAVYFIELQSQQISIIKSQIQLGSKITYGWGGRKRCNLPKHDEERDSAELEKQELCRSVKTLDTRGNLGQEKTRRARDSSELRHIQTDRQKREVLEAGNPTFLREREMKKRPGPWRSRERTK